MTLAPPGVRCDPCAKRTNPVFQPSLMMDIESVSADQVTQPLKESKTPPRTWGLPPRGRSRAPTETRPQKYSLHLSTSAQMETRGLLSRISVRGTLTDVHDKNIRTQVEASNSTPYPVRRTVLDGHSLEHGKSVLRIDQGSSAGYRRIRKQARANQKASSARTPPTA